MRAGSSSRAPSSCAATAPTSTGRTSRARSSASGSSRPSCAIVGDGAERARGGAPRGAPPRSARDLRRARADARRPHGRAARARRRAAARRRRGARGRRSRRARARSRSGCGARTPTSPSASASRRRSPRARSSSGSPGRRPALVLEVDGCVAVDAAGAAERAAASSGRRARDGAAASGCSPRRSRPSGACCGSTASPSRPSPRRSRTAGGDGDGVEVTICARDFEIHVDLVRRARRRRRAPTRSRPRSSSRSRSISSRATRQPIEELVLAALPRARADARDGRVVHRRARRRAADRRSPGSSDVFLGGVVSYVERGQGGGARRAGGGARGARRGLGGDRRGDGARCPRAARRRRRRVGDGDRRARRRHGGEAGRARLPVRVRARAASSRATSGSRATARRCGAARRSARCISCANSSQSCDRNGTDVTFALAWPGVNASASSARCGFPTRRSSASCAGRQRELATGGRIVPPANLHVTLAFLGSQARRRGACDRAALSRRRRRRGATCAFGVRGYRETRSVGMLDARRRGRPGGGARRAALRRGSRRSGVYRREARPWLPHLTVLRFRERPRLAAAASGARRGLSVRRCCLHFPAAVRRGAVRGARSGPARSTQLGG